MENSITSSSYFLISSISSNITTSEPPFRKKNLLANKIFKAACSGEPTFLIAVRPVGSGLLVLHSGRSPT